MKIVLAGAFGKLGIEILKELLKEGHEVVAAGRIERSIDLPEEERKGTYRFAEIDVTKPETLTGLFKGADVAISTIGLTTASRETNCFEVDYRGNVNLMREARRAGVKKFHYISVIGCDDPDAEKVPMLRAKYMAEKKLKTACLKAAHKDGKKMDYVIYRPTGYFYDIIKVFRPYIEKGKMQLLKGYQGVKANVLSCEDFASFILEHLEDTDVTYDVGGKETYSYEEMTKLCFEAAGKPVKISLVPKFFFTILAYLPKIRKEGKRDVILFSKFTLSHDLIGDICVGEDSFAQYIKEVFEKSEE